jgi:hypothetical protein
MTSLILRGATFRAAWRIALVVGTLLSVVNQMTNLVDDPTQWAPWLRVGFNYLVPFVVASVGYLSAFRVQVPQAPVGDVSTREVSPGRPAAAPAATN